MLTIEKIPTTVLFDLDGTLLPMDAKMFERAYFQGLCRRLPEIEPDRLIALIWKGTAAMIANDGRYTNREVFAKVFSELSGIDYFSHENVFLDYYATDFQKLASVCRPTTLSKTIVETLLRHGHRIAIATNPIFPQIATYSRLRWLGLDPTAFELVTTFENCHFAKPNLDYYREVLANIKTEPSATLHIGNDVEEDGCVSQLGMRVILITDCLLNPRMKPLESFETATLAELAAFCSDEAL